MKQLAIIAPTASGKTALSIQMAHDTNSIILSLDSLAVYKDIDIASAKPTLKERDGIIHFGIDELYPDETFDVMKFIDIYHKAKDYALKKQKNIIIVGGTIFYLKALTEGISQVPKIDEAIKSQVKLRLNNLEDSYQFLLNLDKIYMQKIASNDKYRIQKALELYLQTSQTPSQYFKQNPPQPIIKNLEFHKILLSVEKLRQRISLRTKQMLKDGLIDEVVYLEKKYTREPNAMSSIGIKETLDYIDSKLSKSQLEEQISIHTAQLAKRQRSFIKAQFKDDF